MGQPHPGCLELSGPALSMLTLCYQEGTRPGRSQWTVVAWGEALWGWRRPLEIIKSDSMLKQVPNMTVSLQKPERSPLVQRLWAVSILSIKAELPGDLFQPDSSMLTRSPARDTSKIPHSPLPHCRIFLWLKYSLYKTSAAHMKCHSGERAEHAA